MKRIFIAAVIVFVSAIAGTAAQTDSAEPLAVVIGKIDADRAEGNYEAAVDVMTRLVLAGDGKEWLDADGAPMTADAAHDVIGTAFSELVNELWNKQTPEADALVKDLMLAQLTHHPDDAGALQILATMALEAGDNAKALEYYNKTLEYYPDNYHALFYSARIYFAEENDAEAAKRFKKCLEISGATEEQTDYIHRALDFIENHTSELSDYDFEFRFLPPTAADMPVGSESIALLSNPALFVGDFMAKKGWRLRGDFGEITAETFGAGSEVAVVWTMPMPKEAPLARYIAFVPDASANDYKVYFLEKSLPFDENEIWVVGHSSMNNHENYGDVALPTSPGDFLKKVQSIIKNQIKAKASSRGA
ncbi:MAG: tetratricopeptide repeat protein [Bacteroidales bacterium]|nr:tetratricopeptide repeat protein [Bacteroidales bacterium]